MSLLRRLPELFRKPLVHNFLALLGVQVASYLLPLITLPYTARVLTRGGSLGPWGLIAKTQSFQIYIVVLIEYGFLYTATRQIAERRHDPAALGEIVAGVTGAKVVLAALSLLFLRAIVVIEPSFYEDPRIFWAGFAWAVMQAFHPIWFFQGIERLRLVSGVDIFAKCVMTAGTFLLVRSPADAWKVVGLQALGASISTTFGMVYMLRTVRPRLTRVGLIWDALRSGFMVFLSRGGVMLYAVNNSFILSFFRPKDVVGIYANAEKLMKPATSLTIGALSQALYPRIAYLLRDSRPRAAALVYKSVWLFAGIGIAATLLVMLVAPLAISILFSTRFAASIPILRVLSLNLGLIALSTILGMLWMLPLRMDRAFNVITLAAGVANLLVATVLVPRFGAMGMAWTTVIAEVVATGGCFVVLRWYGLDPITLARQNRDQATPADGPAVPGVPGVPGVAPLTTAEPK